MTIEHSDIPNFLIRIDNKILFFIQTDLRTHGQMNVFVVDWSYFARWDYLHARRENLLYVAHAIKAVIMNLIRIYEIEEKDVPRFLCGILMIGHSLGAHMAGWVGELIRLELKAALKLWRDKTLIGIIVGLDPAGPFLGPGYDPSKGYHFLTHNNARKVIVLHSSSVFLGTAYTTAHQDFFLNGGGLVIKVAPILSHMRVLNIIRALILAERDLVVGYVCERLEAYKWEDIKKMEPAKFDVFTLPNMEDEVERVLSPIYMHVAMKQPFVGGKPHYILSHSSTTRDYDHPYSKVSFGNLFDLAREFRNENTHQPSDPAQTPPEAAPDAPAPDSPPPDGPSRGNTGDSTTLLIAKPMRQTNRLRLVTLMRRVVPTRA